LQDRICAELGWRRQAGALATTWRPDGAPRAQQDWLNIWLGFWLSGPATFQLSRLSQGRIKPPRIKQPQPAPSQMSRTFRRLITDNGKSPRAPTDLKATDTDAPRRPVRSKIRCRPTGPRAMFMYCERASRFFTSQLAAQRLAYQLHSWRPPHRPQHSRLPDGGMVEATAATLTPVPARVLMARAATGIRWASERAGALLTGHPGLPPEESCPTTQAPEGDGTGIAVTPHALAQASEPSRRQKLARRTWLRSPCLTT
jgi:hypothetical protein